MLLGVVVGCGVCGGDVDVVAVDVVGGVAGADSVGCGVVGVADSGVGHGDGTVVGVIGVGSVCGVGVEDGVGC